MWEFGFIALLVVIGGIKLGDTLCDMFDCGDTWLAKVITLAIVLLCVRAMSKLNDNCEYCNFRDEHYEEFHQLHLRIYRDCDNPKHEHNRVSNNYYPSDYDYSDYLQDMVP